MEELAFAFEIDAGKLVAKLHRAACSTHPDCYYFNTGIINDQDIKPDESGKKDITFNFDIKTDQYEVGCLFKKPIVIDVSKLLEELEKKQGQDDKDKKQASKKPDEKPGTQNEKSGTQKSGAEKTGTEKDEEPDDGPEGGPTPSDPSKSITNEAEESTTKPDAAKTGAEDEAQPKVALADMNIIDLVKRNDFMHALDNVIKQAIDDQKTKMAPPIFDYIKTFTGKTDVKADDLAICYMPKNMMNPYKIKKYDSTVIPYMEPEDVRKMILEKVEQAKTLKQLKKLEFDNICFKVGYSLHIAD